MKNRKWLTYTVGILLTLVVLTAVAGAGFRAGMMQTASFARPAFAHNFDGAPMAMQRNAQDNGEPQAAQGNPQEMQGNFHDNGGPQGMQKNAQNRGFDNRSGDRRGGFSFFPPIFGLIRLAVLGLLLWIGYTFVKKSGWRLSFAKTSTAPAVTETPSVVVEEEKTSE